MMIGITILVVVIVLALIVAALAVRVVQQYERGVVFRLGRVQGATRGPGLTVITPVIDRLRKVNLQITTLGVPGQDCITRDNVSVRVDAVVYFRVVDPVKALVNVRDYLYAVSQVSQTTLRAVIGRADLDELLSNRDKLNAELTAIIDTPTEGPWGVKVERVEVKDVSLPEGMKRSMSRQAEAERERRARVIAADGEYQASQKLAQAAAAMSADPAALQLRLLQTVVEVAAEKNSTLVMPFPVELLRFLDNATPNDRSGTVHFAAPVEPGTDVEPTAEAAPAAEPATRIAPAVEPSSQATPAVESAARTTPAVEPVVRTNPAVEPAAVSAPPMPADTVASEVPARAVEPATGMPGGMETSEAPVETETEAMPARSDGPVSPAAAVNGQSATNT